MSDHALVNQALNRAAAEEAVREDPDAFAEIIERYQMVVFGYLRSRVMQVSDAEDLTQEVFLRYYQGRARFDSTRLLRPYLLGIARNLLRERARTLNRRNEVAWTELCMELEDIAPDDEDAYEEFKQHLPACLESLGEAARTALQMHYRAKLKFKEIAVELGRTAGAVKLLMFRARKALKRLPGRETGPGDR